MNNWFILVVAAVEFGAGIQCLMNKNLWLGLTWLAYGISCVCLYMNGRS